MWKQIGGLYSNCRLEHLKVMRMVVQVCYIFHAMTALKGGYEGNLYLKLELDSEADHEFIVEDINRDNFFWEQKKSWRENAGHYQVDQHSLFTNAFLRHVFHCEAKIRTGKKWVLIHSFFN